MTDPLQLHWSSASDGRIADAVYIESPNQDLRPPGVSVEMVVIHFISLPAGQFGGEAITSLFTNRLDERADPSFAGLSHLRVSSHFLIRRDGGLIQYVPCERRAWHAGVSSWQGRSRCNDFSIGIELEGCEYLPFEADQYRTLRALLLALKHRYDIVDVVGHEHIAPGRKIDPGPCFDWSAIA